MQSSYLLALNKRIYCFTIVCLLSVFLYTFNICPANFRAQVGQDFVEPVTAPRNSQTTPRNGDLKYILLWSSTTDTPFNYFDEGRSVFLKKKCPFNNCHVTGDRNYLGDYTEFDVIAFNGPQLNHLRSTNDLPVRRGAHQKYVYANIESAEIYPICSKVWNGYFNWTWTYRLDSTAVWAYFTVRDRNNTIIGPNMDMHWIQPSLTKPIHEDLKVHLSTKTRIAAWFVSNCNTMSLREDFVGQLKDHLKDMNLEVDIYGDCGPLQCPKSIMSRCLKMIENKYFFYFAFENALSEDYVTEKVLHALQHNAVPVVYGGANYSRFLPKGSYLDAKALGPKQLAKTMFYIIHHPQVYHKFFRWKEYYLYQYTHNSPDSDVYCKFCEVINNKTMLETKTVVERIDLWWSPRNFCKNFNPVK